MQHVRSEGLRAVLQRMGLRTRSAGKYGRYGIYKPAAFRAIIQRERGRSDRNSHGFSVVMFEMRGDEPSREPRTEQLVKLLSTRCRFTDEVGWLSETKVGVLLPETNIEGAWVFADHVRYALIKPGPAPVCQVFSYPSGGLDRGSEDNEFQLVFKEIVDTLPPSPLAAQSKTRHLGPAASRHAATDIGLLLEEDLPLWKRSLDIVGALLGLVLFAPTMCLVAVYIKLVSRGPVLFRQERVGYLGQVFMCWKFRTMYQGGGASSHRSHLRNLIRNNCPLTKLDAAGRDPRVIPMGWVLRQSGLDELPQLFNVLRGEMSLVGPRPCIPYEYDEYRHWQRSRVHARPGLTGLWQVSGKNRTTFYQMMRLDILYSRQMSFWLDAQIILKTVPALVQQVRQEKNASTATRRAA